MKRVILLLAIMYGVASASAATMGEKIAQGWLPVMVPPGQTLDDLVTNKAIPEPGCTDLGTSVNLVLSGATVAYVANPTGVYTVSVTRASSAGYVYTLTTFSTNSYTLASGLQLYGAHTIGATNEFVFIPQTNAVYKVRAQKVQ